MVEEFSPLDQEVELDKWLPEFMKVMKGTIMEATEKYGDFTQYQLDDFYSHYTEEINELDREFQKSVPDYKATMEEAVGVANMAFIIWWSAKRERDKLSKMVINHQSGLVGMEGGDKG